MKPYLKTIVYGTAFFLACVAIIYAVRGLFS